MTRELCEGVGYSKLKCRNVVAKECNDVPKEDCTYEEIKCENVDEEVCDTIPREVCQDVTKNECRSVPREDCQVMQSLQLGSQSISYLQSSLMPGFLNIRLSCPTNLGLEATSIPLQ